MTKITFLISEEDEDSNSINRTDNLGLLTFYFFILKLDDKTNSMQNVEATITT